MELKTAVLNRISVLFSKNTSERELEREIFLFIISRVEMFKRIDYDLTLELISEKRNIPLYKIKKIIKKFSESQNKVIVRHSSFCLNS